MTQAPPFIPDQPNRRHNLNSGRRVLASNKVVMDVAKAVMIAFAVVGLIPVALFALVIGSEVLYLVPLELVDRLSGVALAAIAVFLGLICFKMK